MGDSEVITFSASADFFGGDENIANVTTDEGVSDEDYANVMVIEADEPNIEIIKKVRNFGSWLDSETFLVGEDVEFKITVINTGTIDLSNVHVVDYLPSFLTYNYDATDSPTVELDNHIEWNLGILPMGDSEVITFSASADFFGDDENIANVTTDESVSDEDYANVIVDETCDPFMLIDKTVWNDTSNKWEDSIEAEVGDIIRFNITVNYYGDNILYNINVTDTLPDCLEYDNNADPVQSGIIDNKIYWNLTGIILEDGESYYIEFDAEVVSTGININIANLTANECGENKIYDEDIATIYVGEYNIFEKKVWNKTSDKWEESIKAEIGDIVRFNITVRYFGDYLLYNISIKDTLPDCLMYIDKTGDEASGIIDNIIYWNLTGIVLEDGESYSIEFDAEVVSTGININVANLIADECSGEIWEFEDTAIVIVDEPKILEKKVWNDIKDEWVESINAEIGDIVRFNITVRYFGDYLLYNINITDTLPNCLEYADNADPIESGISDNIIYWNLTDIVLEDGESYSIEFDAEVVSTGTNINVANLITDECSGEIWELEDTAKVIVEPYPLFEKKVWNHTNDKWDDIIEAEIGDIVRFNISVSYYGSNILYNIEVIDILPDGLEYANNADPAETEISGNIIKWDIDETLENGDRIYIEFDAEVIEIGKNVNKANITGIECPDGSRYSDDTAIVYGIEVTESLVADAGGPYSGYIDEIIQFTGSASGGKSPYTYEWDLDNDGEYDDGTGITVSKSWETTGTFTIRLMVTDDYNRNDTDTAYVTISEENTKPNKPDRPSGETEGRFGDDYTYSTRTVDPEGDQVYYLWDWGDGTNSGWTGPYNSGSTVVANHTWDERGNYEIKVRAKDTGGLLSDWSDPLSISMPRYLKIDNIIIQILEKIIQKFPLLEYIYNNYIIQKFLL
jgi:uncharacterized repeat protein (TIGR01451 family)/fimbrial isopeptide formation D2 family protein